MSEKSWLLIFKGVLFALTCFFVSISGDYYMAAAVFLFMWGNNTGFKRENLV